MDGWNIISFATLLELSFNWTKQLICDFVFIIVVTYEIQVFFEGAQKEVFSSIFKKTL